MSTHEDHAPHHGPSNFFTKYVFSTDHKVIGIQFMFAALLFVIIGGLLALGVRYQLAWPNQNVPYAKILPGKMTNKAPEANVALWKTGCEVEIKSQIELGGKTLEAKDTVTLTGFPQGLAVTLPAGMVVRNESGNTRTLDEPVNAFVDSDLAMADYDYAKQNARTVKGIAVTVPATDNQLEHQLILVGAKQQVVRDDRVKEEISNGAILLPIRAADTPISIELSDGTRHQTSAGTVTYYKETLTTDAYLQLFTMHASVMIFLVIIPMLVGGFGNFLIPLMIGARDMAFPKLNMLAFWLAAPAGAILLLSFWTPGGAAGGGWTSYPPLSETAYSGQVGTTLWIAAVGLVGFSSVIGALNYITTILNMRAPGMTMFRMPLTVWAMLITSILALLATPVLTASMVLLLLDRTLGTYFFISSMGGQPLMFQHLFWFYSHPAVYIMILPAMGVVSDILACHARKPIFGYKPMIYAMATITGLGFIVWGHHMFQSGMNPVLGTTFMASTIMISVPSAIKTFNWLGTLWGGNIRYTPPMLNALGFVSMFVIGGLSGIFMASAPVDIPIHDTYFIVAHIHYVLFGGSLFAIFAGIYQWFPKMFGRQLNQQWGTIHFWMNIIAFNGTFFLMHILGIGGHPRRYASIMEYPTLQHLQPMNVVMTIFAMMLGMAQIPFFYNVFASLPRKLGRAVLAVFIVMLGLPMVMGLTFWKQYDPEAANMLGALGGSMINAAMFIVAVTIAVFMVWAIGGALRMPTILGKLLHVIWLPAFMAPVVLKHDPYLWIGMPQLFAHRCLILGLLALPGLAYLVVMRPKDRFGFDAGTNPWEANSLEWTTSSPPPHLNFDEIPTVHRGPYEYSSPVVEEDYLTQVQVLPAGVVEPTGH